MIGVPALGRHELLLDRRVVTKTEINLEPQTFSAEGGDVFFSSDGVGASLGGLNEREDPFFE